MILANLLRFMKACILFLSIYFAIQLQTPLAAASSDNCRFIFWQHTIASTSPLMTFQNEIIIEKTRQFFLKLNEITDSLPLAIQKSRATDSAAVLPILSLANGAPYNEDFVQSEITELELKKSAALTRVPIARFDPRSLNELYNIRNNYRSAKEAMQDPEIAEMAELTNESLQSISMMTHFFENFALDMVTARLSSKKPHDTAAWFEFVKASSRPLFNIQHDSDHATDTLLGRVKHVGWLSVIYIDEMMNFMTDSLAKRRLPSDPELRDLSHGANFHIVQIVFVSEILFAKFGAEKTMQFFEFLAKPEGRGLWNLLFDRGPSHIADFRGPQFFSLLKLHLLLGIE